MRLRFFLIIIWGVSLFASPSKSLFNTISDSSLEKVVKEGWQDQKRPLQQQVITIFNKNRKQLEAKIDTPVTYKKEKFTPLGIFPEIQLKRKDLEGILAYTHYLESIGDVNDSIAYRERILRQKMKVRSDLLLMIIVDIVYEQQIINAFKASLEHNYYTHTQQCDIAFLLSHTLNVDKERFFRGIEIEKEWAMSIDMRQGDVEEHLHTSFEDTNATAVFLTEVNKYKNQEIQRLYQSLEEAMREESKAALDQWNRDVKKEQEALFTWQAQLRLYTNAFYVKLLSLFGFATPEDMAYTTHYIAKILTHVAMPKLTETYWDWLKMVQSNRQFIQVMRDNCQKGNESVRQH